jgi:peptide/nickel transport system substrate-binding protein
LYYDQWYSKSPNNITRYNNSKFDEIFIKAKYETDETQRYILFRQCENILKDDLPAAPIYYINTVICTKPNIMGVYSTSLGNVKLDYLEVIE